MYASASFGGSTFCFGFSSRLRFDVMGFFSGPYLRLFADEPNVADVGRTEKQKTSVHTYKNQRKGSRIRDINELKPADMGCEMYRSADKNQLTMDEFMLPFGGYLSADNRWVKIAKLIPWDVVEAEYAKSMCEVEGRESLPARMAYGALHIEVQEGLTDERTVEYLRENPYAQYFVGLKVFREDALFDASMMVHFRKRFPPEAIQRINEALYERTHPKAKEPPTDGDEGSEKDQSAPPPDDSQNEGTLMLDATVAPADIRYPTDLGLLNECRENTEKMIETLWEHTDKQGHKTAYSRKKARKSYMQIVKQRQPRAKAVQRAITEQLEYVRKNLATLESMLATVGYGILSAANWFRLCIICKVYRQQRQMADGGKRRCEDRIVSLR